jgi:hypothetical protein
MPILFPTVLLLLAALAPSVADSPEEEKRPPHAVISFPEGHPKAWITTFELTTASGARYEVRFNYRDGMDFYAETAALLLAANWVVELTAFTCMRVHGARTKRGETDPVRSLVLVHHLVEGKGAMPLLRSVDGVKVEVKTDDGTAKTAPAGKPPPTGPDLGAESYVEFDLSTVPAGAGKAPPSVTFEIYTTAGSDDSSAWISTPVDPAAPAQAAAGLLESLSQTGCKAEVVGQTRLRVYGQVRGDRYYPALKGSVDSDDLRPEELPKVTNPRS